MNYAQTEKKERSELISNLLIIYGDSGASRTWDPQLRVKNKLDLYYYYLLTLLKSISMHILLLSRKINLIKTNPLSEQYYNSLDETVIATNTPDYDLF
jgi:hypothetical protein